MKKEILLICFMVALLAGCNSPGQQQNAEKYQGREDTKKIEGASAVGYDGTAMRKNVDNSLNRNDGRNQELDKALKSSSEGEQKQ